MKIKIIKTIFLVLLFLFFASWFYRIIMLMLLACVWREEIKRYIDRGLLVPDHITIEIVKHILSSDEFKNNYLLDGFPRTVIQARMMDFITKYTKNPVELVINLDIKEGLLIDRLTGREICRNCNAIYHKLNKPSKVEGICDVCGEPLVQRADDNAETVANRIEVYEAQTKPLVDYYENAGNIAHIDGATELDNVFADIVKALGE
mgnify:CR=1 FL=1